MDRARLDLPKVSVLSSCLRSTRQKAKRCERAGTRIAGVLCDFTWFIGGAGWLQVFSKQKAGRKKRVAGFARSQGLLEGLHARHISTVRPSAVRWLFGDQGVGRHGWPVCSVRARPPRKRLLAPSSPSNRQTSEAPLSVGRARRALHFATKFETDFYMSTFEKAWCMAVGRR